MERQFRRVGGALVNTKQDDLDKYYAERRAIKDRKAAKSEYETITDMLTQLMNDVAEIKRRLDS